MAKKINGSAVLSSPEKARRVRHVLDLLAQLVPQIARSIGPNCEVVLHDNRTPPPRILAIGNGHVTQRGAGDLMTQISIADTEMHDSREPLFNYESVTPQGTQLRVSTLPVRVDGVTAAYLSINFATSDLIMAQNALAQLTRTEPHAKQIHETFLPSSLQMHEVIERAMQDFARPGHLLTRQERIALMHRLNSQGVLRLRGAVRDIATRLRISRAAVYGYLKLVTTDSECGERASARSDRT